MTEKTLDKKAITEVELKQKLEEAGLDKYIDLDFYLRAKDGGVGSAFPIAELLGSHPETGEPFYVARRDCWEEGEYVIGMPAIAYNHEDIKNFTNLPGHLKFIAQSAKMTTYVGTTFFKLKFEKDVNGEYYLHLRSYTPNVEDTTICDWTLTSMSTFHNMYFAKPLELDEEETKEDK